MPQPILRPPTPDDAEAWFTFLLAEQVRTYDGLVPATFAEQHLEARAEWLADLAASFASPGTARRLVAEADGELVGVAGIVDAPQDWEIGAGFTPAPAARQLERLYLRPDQHGTGLAAAMFADVDDGRALYLWLIDGNARAQRFYRRLGFVDLDERHLAGSSWGGTPMHRMVRQAGG